MLPAFASFLGLLERQLKHGLAVIRPAALVPKPFIPIVLIRFAD
jgi:hypothetical protein